MDAECAAVIKHVAHDLKRSGGALTESHGQMLAAVLHEDALVVFQAASELIERRAVKKYTAEPSQRCFFRVESQNRARFHAQDPLSPTADMTSSSAYYNCFDHYCSCAAFQHHVLQSPHAMCKHMVALLLADAMDKCECIRIQDVDFANMLCPTA